MASQPLSAKVKAILDNAVSAPDGPAGIVYGAIDKHGNILVSEAAGKRALGGSEPMTTDSCFPLYSTTKLLVTIAALQLVEQGKLSLDDPIHTLLPEIKAVKRLMPNGSIVENTRDITLRMLLTHTAGFGYAFFNPILADFWRAGGGPDEFNGTREGLLDLPLVNEPGTRWEYSIGIDWAGEAVARASGLSLGEYLKKNLFEPLGIADEIGFHLTPALESKLVSLHQRGEDGKLRVRDHQPFVHNAKFESGGAGALGTQRAYLTVLAALLNGGTGTNGARMLTNETVQSMFVDQVAGVPGLHETIQAARKELTYPVPTIPGYAFLSLLFLFLAYNERLRMRKGWGLSFELNLDPLPTGRSANSGSWAGLANLYYTVDPTKGVATMIMSQSFPFFDPAVTGPFVQAEAAVYASLK